MHHVVSVLCDPKEQSLDPGRASSLARRWKGQAPVWLHETAAAEFKVPEKPSDWEEAWAEHQSGGIDLVIQPESARRKRLLVADMDSTIIMQECIDELADEAGRGSEVKAITERAMNGEIDFEQALRMRVAALKGQDAGIIDRVMENRVQIAEGAKTLLATMAANGARSALVSGGFTAFAKRVAEQTGFSEFHANTLAIRSGLLTGEVETPILGRDAKTETLDRLVKEMGIRHADALAVGDGANDLGMLMKAGLGVAMRAKPSVQASCGARINHCDLTALLYLQGYSASDFISA